ncbi:hypothetical protein COLO4_22821 [Corchorus olitorius]|uniref:Uncharacterized protein n=1 Tax=Corchorus olitorius TaxID=93759 RepID=A0A1R3IJQ0_9ROSI|nr:hypothetical protein COLO4_22821 [Corchorus olitorius]
MKRVVVFIWTTSSSGRRESELLGGGVFIDDKGTVLTRYLPDYATSNRIITVSTEDGRHYRAEKCEVAKYKRFGLTRLKIEVASGPQSFDYAEFATVGFKLGDEIHCFTHGNRYRGDITAVDENNAGVVFNTFEYQLVGHISNTDRRLSDILDNGIDHRKHLKAAPEELHFVNDIEEFKELACDWKRDLRMIQANNVYSSGSGAGGVPFFDKSGRIVGLFGLTYYDQVCGIHADEIKSSLEALEAPDTTSGSVSASISKTPRSKWQYV